MPLSKRQRSGESDNDEMDNFEQQNFTQQRHLIFEKLLNIENVNNEKIDKLMADIVLLNEKVSELQEENVKQKKMIFELKEENSNLKMIVNNVEQLTQADSVILYGLPRSKEVSDFSVIKNVGDQLNIAVNEGDVSDIFRIGSQPDDDDDDEEENVKCPPLVVKFTRKALKNKFMHLKRKKKVTAENVGYKNCKNQVYINEFLTRSNLELLKYAQQLKEFGFKYVWAARGKILVRCEKGASFTIDNKDHVDRLLNRERRRSSQQ